jgi:hypothetical protein
MNDAIKIYLKAGIFKTDNSSLLNFIIRIKDQIYYCGNTSLFSKEILEGTYDDLPSLERPSAEYKVWYENGKKHRLTGPALIHRTGCDYWLEGEYYENVKEWINSHPNPDLYFHKIGVFTETDKVLWYLQN